MASQKHIEKIRSLLRLTRSPFRHESELARSRAKEIAVKYGIDLRQLCKEEGVPEEPLSLEEKLAMIEKQLRMEILRREQLEATIHEVQRKKPAEDGNVEKLKAEIRSLKAEIKKQAGELHDAEKCIHDLRRETQTLRRENEGLYEKEKSIRDLQREIQTLGQESKEREREMDKLKELNEFKTIPRNWAEIADLKQQLKQERGRNSREREHLWKELRTWKYGPWPAGLRLSNDWEYQGEEGFTWAVYLTDGEVGILKRVLRVHYIFPKSFREPVKEVNDSQYGFRIVGKATESFRIRAFAHMDTSQIVELAHKLVLKKEPATGSTDS